MKLHLVTIGKPKLTYAALGWDEYVSRLKHYHAIRITHIADKHNNASHISQVIGNSFVVVLDIDGHQLSSPEFAQFLDKKAFEGREISFVIGGPDGLPKDITDSADYSLSFSKLTFPHDLAMVILVEALYRASSISAGSKYHK